MFKGDDAQNQAHGGSMQTKLVVIAALVLSLTSAVRAGSDDVKKPASENAAAESEVSTEAGDDLLTIRQVNINTASRRDLETILLINSAKAQAIIDRRPFKTVEEVMEAKGITKKTFESIRDRITVR
jgi:competence protein ComEA